MLGIPARDVTSGFRAYRADVASPTSAVRSTGTDSRSGWRIAPRKTGGAIAEVPITFRDRAAGQSSCRERSS
jgi:hypothetical protein